MLNSMQVKMVAKGAKELERQLDRLNTEHAKYEHLQETPAFEPVTEASIMHNAQMNNFVDLLKRPDYVHIAVWEHTFDAVCHAFSNVLEAYNALDSNQGKSDFAQIVESKQEHTAVEEAPAPDTGKVEVVMAAPELIEDPPEAEEEAKAESEPEKHTVDMDAQCSRVESLTEGQCHTLNEAMQKAQDCGMRVVDDKPAESA